MKLNVFSDRLDLLRSSVGNGDRNKNTDRYKDRYKSGDVDSDGDRSQEIELSQIFVSNRR